MDRAPTFSASSGRSAACECACGSDGVGALRLDVVVCGLQGAVALGAAPRRVRSLRVGYALLSDVHVHAILTAAVRWTEKGASIPIPESARRELEVARQDPESLGLALLLQNWNTAIYGGDPDEVGEDEVEYGDELAAEEGNVKPTLYSFQELPGAPRAETVLRLLHSYRAHSSWEGRSLGSVGPFLAAMEQCARDELGDLDDAEIRALPGYAETPALPGYLAPDWDIYLPAT